MASSLRKYARSFGFATALLSQVFMASAIAAENDYGLGVPTNPEDATRQTTLQAMLQDMSDHPLAGGPALITVCVRDGMERNKGEEANRGGADVSCDQVEVTLPLPKLNNPLGYEIQALRRELALGIEQAPRDADGRPTTESLRAIGYKVAGDFETFFDQHSTEFQKPETLITVMDMHYDLLNIAERADMPAMEEMIAKLRTVTLKLEDDLLSDAAKELKDAQEPLKEALEKGAPSKEIQELNERLMDAMKGFMDEQKKDDSLSAADKKALEDMQKMMEALKKALEEMGMTPEEFAELMQQMMQGGGMPQPPQAGKQQQMSFEQMLQAMKQMIEQMQKMQKYMKDINEIIDEQQDVRDKTLSEALREDAGLPHEPGMPTTEDLEKRQEALKDRLSDLIDKMKQDGIDTKPFEFADKEMGEAESDLENSDEGGAVPNQDKALEALRGGNQNMAAMMMMMMQGAGNMSGTMPGSGPPGSGVNDGSFVDGDGKLRSSDNPNEALGLQTEDPNNRSRGVRDEILQRRKQSQGTGHDDYLDRLLRGPNSP